MKTGRETFATEKRKKKEKSVNWRRKQRRSSIKHPRGLSNEPCPDENRFTRILARSLETSKRGRILERINSFVYSQHYLFEFVTTRVKYRACYIFPQKTRKNDEIGLNGGTKCFHSWRGTGRDGSLSLGRADGSSRIIIVKSVRMQGICGEFRWNQSPASRIWVATYFFNARLFQDIEDTRRGLIVSWTVSRGFFRRNGTFETRVTEFHRSKFTLSIILLKKWEKAKKRNRWMMKIYKTKTVTRSLFEGESLKIRWSTLLFIIWNIPTNYRTNLYIFEIRRIFCKKEICYRTREYIRRGKQVIHSRIHSRKKDYSRIDNRYVFEKLICP